MREEKRILRVLGQVDEKYIQEAAPGKRANKKPAWIKWASIAACLAVLIAAALPFMQNDSETFTPNDDVFPPASTQTPNGAMLPTAVSADGLHLVQLTHTVPAATEIATDFIIHINPKAYASWEENGTYVIRPTTPMGEGLPECSLQISRIADVTPVDAVEAIKENLTASYLNVDDIADAAAIDGLFLHADNGSTQNAEQVDITITDDLLGGSYVLAARYYRDATDGYGVRFADMVGTFKAVTSADTAAMPAYLAKLNRTISLFTLAFFTDNTSEMNDLSAQDALLSTYGTDVAKEVGIASVDYSIGGDEDPAAAVVSVKHRLGAEDSFNYLTIELTYTADDEWVVNYAGIEK